MKRDKRSFGLNKTVTRRYWSKKKGEYVTKTYEYGKNLTFVDKQGRVKRKNIENYLNTFKDKYGVITDMDSYQRAKRFIENKVNDKEAVTLRTVTSTLERNRRIKMLINTGFTKEEGLANLGVTEEEFVNEANWESGGIFINPRTGVKLQYQWNYEGDIWTIVK